MFYWKIGLSRVMPLLISITVQSILAMNLLKDFKLVFTQEKWLTNLILTESIRVKHCLN